MYQLCVGVCVVKRTEWCQILVYFSTLQNDWNGEFGRGNVKKKIDTGDAVVLQDKALCARDKMSQLIVCTASSLASCVVRSGVDIVLPYNLS